MSRSFCAECLRKQQEIDRLTEEVKRLRGKLCYQQRREKEGFFGSATPSSKKPVKANAPAREAKRKGAKPGHKGAGRKSFDEAGAEAVTEVEAVGDVCPECGGPLTDKGVNDRMVVECRPVKAQRLLYRLPKKHCPRCGRTFRSCAPGVLPKWLYGNQLIANCAVMHYFHGVPMGRVCEQIGIEPGSLVEIFHRLARLFANVPDRLIGEYRQSPVKHADETGWRTNGKNGYVWLFATDNLSIFQFRKTRSASVAQAVFGKEPLPGVLVVDRYAGYNKAPCAIQYCHAHLLRELQDLGKEFPDNQEVRAFADAAAPLLSLAMALRGQPISDSAYYRQADRLAKQIRKVMNAHAQHLGIRAFQNIFRENEKRLYRWVKDRRVPPDNNLAERDLRPTVIARKTSFGSASDAGACTRGILMTVLYTLKKQGVDVASHLKHVLDQLATDIHQDPFPLLFPRASPRQ